MREIRTSGSVGGLGSNPQVYPIAGRRAHRWNRSECVQPSPSIRCRDPKGFSIPPFRAPLIQPPSGLRLR